MNVEDTISDVDLDVVSSYIVNFNCIGSNSESIYDKPSIGTVSGVLSIRQ